MNRQNWVFICALKPEWHLLKKQIHFSKIQEAISIPSYQASSHSKNIRLYQIGIGYQKASQSIHHIFETWKDFPHLIIHFGFSGALIPKLNPGDLFLPSEVINHLGKTIQFDSMLHQKTAQLFKRVGINFREGRLFTSSKVLATPQEKEEQGILFKSQAIDMETFPVAEACLQRKIPFLSIRSIFDPLEWNLSDLGEEGVMTKEGKTAYSVLAKQIIKYPKLLMSLPKYQKASAQAGKAITRALMKILNNF